MRSLSENAACQGWQRSGPIISEELFDAVSGYMAKVKGMNKKTDMLLNIMGKAADVAFHFLIV